jgi:putative SOS response-associated peptidase YedK
MCNLYAQTKGPQAILEASRAMLNLTGSLPPQPAIFPDKMAPIVRTGADGQRELIMARWGFPPPAYPGQKAPRPVTTVRNVDSRHWSPWLREPATRCLVPVTSFSEPDNRAGDGSPSIWTWFAKDKTRPVMFFAGICRDWRGTRGTKAQPEAGLHLLYSFLTTAPAPDVQALHPLATPVLLIGDEDREAWMTAPWEIARELQKKPLPAGTVKIVFAGDKKDLG